MRLRGRLAALAIAAICAMTAAGCSQVPFHDDSYKTKIPAALEAADLGISNAWAGVSLSGFTDTLSVGGSVDLDRLPGQEVSPQFVRRVVVIALENRSMPTAFFQLSLRDDRDNSIDTRPALAALGATPGYSGTIPTGDAEKIVRATT